MTTAVGDEFAVNSTTEGDQFFPQIASSFDGSFTTVWDSVGQDGDGHGIVGRRFDAEATPLSDEFLVNTATQGDQLFPSIDMSAAGQAVVVWEGEDKDGRGVFGRRYDQDGSAMGDEFLVNSSETGDQMLPQVSVDSNGDFLVVWNEVQRNPYLQRIVGRRFDSTGTATSDDFVVNSPSQEIVFFGTGVLLDDGQFVAAWEQRDELVGRPEIVARFFDDSGQGGEEILVSTEANNNSYPDIATDRDGRVVIVWNRQTDENHSVIARQFNHGADSPSDEIEITDSPISHSLFPAVAMDNEGNFVAVWDEFARDGDGQGSFGRLVSFEGVIADSVFQLNTTVVDDQQLPAAAIAASYSFVTVWDSHGQDGDGHGVFGQRFESAPPTGSISGYVYADVNNNGLMDPQEIGLPNVPIVLTGPYNTVVETNDQGYYRFEDVPPGLYTVTQVQPAAFIDGLDTAGVPAMGSTQPNQFTGIRMLPNLDITLYNFGERGLKSEYISKRYYLALSPSAEDLVAEIMADTTKHYFTFDAEAAGELTVEIGDAEGEGAAVVDLYSPDMLPLELGGDNTQLYTEVVKNQNLVLVVDGLEASQTVDVSIRLRPYPPVPAGPKDVNRDGIISPIDALLVINFLTLVGSSIPVVAGSANDVNGDEIVSPIDAMLIINHLMRAGSAEGESANVSYDPLFTAPRPATTVDRDTNDSHALPAEEAIDAVFAMDDTLLSLEP